MRINTNVSALTAANNLNRVQNAVSESMAKLSSGFRINKAADDAAGLGIANKLRADGRALSQASRNADQTNSLLQVAEGSTSTIQSILERMKELATQAGSDTVDANGRAQIQSEFSSLRSEIDRTVSTTKFEGNGLLDGTFGVDANAISTSDITLDPASTASAGTYTFTVSNGVVSLDKGSTNIGKVTVSALAASAYNASTGKTTLTFGSGTGAISVGVNANSATDLSSISADLAGKSFAITAGATIHSAKADATNLTAKGVTVAADVPTALTSATNYSLKVTDASVATTVAAGNMTAGITAPAASGTDASYVIRVVGNNLDVYAANDLYQTTSLATGVVSDAALGAADVAINITAAGAAAGLGTQGAAYTTVKHSAVGSNAAAVTAFDGKTVTVTGATIELDKGGVLQGSAVKLGAWTDGVSKLSSLNVDGVVVSTDNQNSGTDTYAHLKATMNAGSALIEIADRGTGFSSVTSNSVTGNNGVHQASFLVDSSGQYKSNDAVKLSAINLTTSALGITDSDLSTSAGAVDAMSKIDSAITTVSQALGSIGANQNRISYAQDSLKTKISNFSAAESVIRDVDMADEMTTFSKNQILAQAGTAMLAQANQLGQGVLQLLRG